MLRGRANHPYVGPMQTIAVHHIRISGGTEENPTEAVFLIGEDDMGETTPHSTENTFDMSETPKRHELTNEKARLLLR